MLGMGMGVGVGVGAVSAPGEPAITLDFVNSNELDPRVTFSRGTNATYVDSAGNIAYAPSNLLTYSEQFDNAAWFKTNATITANTTVAPDGATTGDTFTAAANSSQIQATYTGIAGVVYTASMWIKRRTGAGLVYFRSVENVNTPIAVTDNWQRFDLTVTSTTTTIRCGVFLQTSGDEVDLWGAQLNLDGLQPYNSTTVKNLLGYTQDFDNAAWTKSNSFIQTNLLTYSEQFDNAAWTKSNSFIQTNQIRNNTAQGAVTGNTGISPTNWSASSTGSGITREIIGAGTESGIAYIDIKYSGTPTASSSVQVAFEGAGTVAASSGQTWTGSTYVTLASGSLSGAACSLSLLETNGTSGVVENSKLIIPVAGELSTSRDSYTATLSGGVATTNIQPRIRIGFVVGVPIDITLRIGLPQLVLGAVPGDVVRTYGTAMPVMYPSPIGTLTADKLIENTTTSGHGVLVSPGVVKANVYTQSIYAKAGERTKFLMQLNAYGGDYIRGYFDLSNGTATSEKAGTAPSVSVAIADVGGGWFRCTVSGQPSTAAGNTFDWELRIGFGVVYSYTGDGTGGIYIWGAQLVQGAIPGDYQATTTAALPVQYRAPDGSLTADKLVENTATSAHFAVAAAAAAITSGTPYTLSFYAKGAERTVVQVVMGSFVFENVFANFDLSAGAVSALSTPNITASITAVGNGWYRCAATSTAISASASYSPFIATQTSPAAARFATYTGDGTSGIYIWGAQLSDSASLDPYSYNFTTAPTAAAYYGPRFDYDPVTLACKGLLIEEQRTNSIRNNTMQGAVAGTPGTAPTNWQTFTSLTGLTREIVGTGAEAGINYIDIRLSGTPSAAGSYNIFSELITTTSAVSGQTWAFAQYSKLAAGSTSGITSLQSVIVEYSSASGFLTQGAASFTPSGAGLIEQRNSFVRTLTNASTAFIRSSIALNLDGAAIDITLRIGLPQLEQGAFATSVIPTTTTAVTRAADVAVIQGANFSNWYNQSEGTLYASVLTANGNGARAITVSDGTINNQVWLREGVVGTPSLEVYTAGSFVAQIGLNVAQPMQSAGAIKTNDFGVSVNGGVVSTDTPGVLGTFSQANIGTNYNATLAFLNGHIARIAYWPRRSADGALQRLTQ